MSLLADLLSKIKQPQTKREIPPNLKSIVQDASKKTAHTKRIILLSVLFAASVFAGLFLVNFLKSLIESSHSDFEVTSPDRGQRTNKEIDDMIVTSGGKLKSEPIIVTKEEENKFVKTAPVLDKKKESIAKLPEKDHSVKDKTVQASVSPEPATIDLPKITGEETPQQEEEQTNSQSLSRELKRADMPERDVYLYTAREHERKNDYSKALSAYKKVLEMDRNNYSVFNNIAYIYLQLDRPEESIRYSETAVDINVDYAPALINLGIAHAKLSNFAAAETYLNRAAGLEPDNQTVILNLAILHERQKNHSEAYEYYTRLVQFNNPEGLLGLARIYELQDRREEALTLYKRVYDLESGDDKTKTRARQRIMLLLNKKDNRKR